MRRVGLILMARLAAGALGGAPAGNGAVAPAPTSPVSWPPRVIMHTVVKDQAIGEQVVVFDDRVQLATLIARDDTATAETQPYDEVIETLARDMSGRCVAIKPQLTTL